MAFLRRKRKRVKGDFYEYWSIVESIRTSRGPRQRTIAKIGKAPGLDEEERVGWENIAEQLSGKSVSGNVQPDMFRAEKELPNWATVDLSRVRVERLRRFGDVYLALALWKRLDLDKFFGNQMQEGREDVPWSIMACLHVLSRFCEPSSDLAIAESFFSKTALDDLLNVSEDKINDDRLYRALDKMLPCREALFEHLRRIYGELFQAEFDLLLYDVTSTYFEGSCGRNDLAARGYSRDSRADCPQICIGLVVTPEGLPTAYETFEGNRPDVATLEDIFDLMESRYGKARRIFVLDRGIVSEANLCALRRRKSYYIVGTPRSELKKFEKELLDKDWEEVESGIEVKMIHVPACADEMGDQDPGGEEKYILCRSRSRIEKDRAIVRRAGECLEKELLKLKSQIITGKLRDRAKAERRVGRLLQRYSRAGRLYQIHIGEVEDPNHKKKIRLTMDLRKDKEVEDWISLQNGCYLLRTNLTHKNAKELWRDYIGLTEAEYAFRELKSPLSLRPVYHQVTHRVEAHVLVAFLALCMRRVLSCWMKESQLGNAPQKLIEELKTVHSLDVALMAKGETEIRLRIVSTPEERVRELLHYLKLKLPNRPKLIQNVVPKTGL